MGCLSTCPMCMASRRAVIPMPDVLLSEVLMDGGCYLPPCEQNSFGPPGGKGTQLPDKPSETPVLPGCSAARHLGGGGGAGPGRRRDGRFDGQVRQDAVQPAGQPPVGAAGGVTQGGGAQQEGVEQDGGGQADADLADDLLAGQDERAEHQDHDGGGGDDDPAGGGLAGADRLVVVAGGGPFLADPGDRFIRHPAAGDPYLRAAVEGRADETFRYGAVAVDPLVMRT